MTRLAFLGRTSTEDQQDPTISLPRQVTSCQSVLPPGVVIVAYFYDVESGRKDLAARGRGRGHERFDIPVPRDGGIQDLLAEAEHEGRRFDAVICESIDRIARRTYFGTMIEHRLEAVGVPLLASDEPISFSANRAKRATQVLTRRVKQGVAEWYVLDMLEKSWGGFEQHTFQGFNIGQPLYGYTAEKIPHPVPARRSEGKTKTRLIPDPTRAPVVRKIFGWRLEGQSCAQIADRLNEDLDLNPPPTPPDPARAVGRWTASSVRDVLTNPKHTGHMVWNRRARRTRSGKNNPIEEWVWSPQPTHQPLISLETFARAQEAAARRERSRATAGPNTAPQTKRVYPLRSFLFCDLCGRRMFGKTRRDLAFYTCAPKPGYIPEGHPPSFWIRETRLLRIIDTFFAERIFGAHRRELLAATLPQQDDTERQRLHEQQAALREAIRNLELRRDRQYHALEVADGLNADFIRGVQERIATLSAEIHTKQDQLHELQQRPAPQHQAPELLDALPIAPVEISALPDAVRRRMFEAFRLQIHYHKPTNSARCRVVLMEDTVASVGRNATAALETSVSQGQNVPICLVPPAGAAEHGKLKSCRSAPRRWWSRRTSRSERGRAGWTTRV